MENYKGVLDFEYFGDCKQVAYTMDNLGGNAHIYFEDKHGRHHTFFYSKYAQRWVLSGNYTLKWPPEFMDVLFAAMDLARERHGL